MMHGARPAASPDRNADGRAPCWRPPAEGIGPGGFLSVPESMSPRCDWPAPGHPHITLTSRNQ